MSRPQKAPLRERVAPDPNGTHHTVDPDAHTGQVVRSGGSRALSGVVVPTAPVDQAQAQMQANRKWAEEMAYSEMVPDTYKGKVNNVLWAIEYAKSLDLRVMVVLNNVYLARGGKPALTSALMSGMVRRPGHRLRVKMHLPNGIPDAEAYAVAQIIRADDPSFTFESSPWNLHRAARAGLVQVVNGRPFARSFEDKVLPWEKYPEAMLKARAISEVIRDACPDTFLGMAVYTPEELGANVDEEGRPLDTGPDGKGFATTEMTPGGADPDGMDLGSYDGPDSAQELAPEPPPEPEEPEDPEGGDGFDPATASHGSWQALITAAADTGDRDTLRELWSLGKQHRSEDDRIAGMLQEAAQRLNQDRAA